MDALWAIVKARQPGTAYEWARVRLGLVDIDDDLPPATPRRADGRVCGWMRVDGVWQCVQDFYAAGMRPETGCGRTWEATA